MAKMFDADRHNFGKCVERIERASGHWYLKPRSVYWEHLFFGKRSPIASIFDFVGPNGRLSLGSFLFNLDVEQENIWFGYSRAVEPARAEVSLDHFYGFGTLIGYCYLFGIRDLHKFNLVIQKNHFQVVDAEVVLTNLILPHETLLLPFREIPFESSAASLLCRDLKDLTDIQIQSVFSGYFDVTTAVLDNLDLIHAVLSHEKLEQYPIRVILKNTKQYRDFLTDSADGTDYIPEELDQLQRGDIPYFYKYIGQNTLCYLSEPSKVGAVNQPSLDLQKEIHRHGRSLALLLGSMPGLIKKTATGALYLRKAFGLSGSLFLESKGGPISFSGSSLCFRDHSFSASSRTV